MEVCLSWQPPDPSLWKQSLFSSSSVSNFSGVCCGILESTSQRFLKGIVRPPPTPQKNDISPKYYSPICGFRHRLVFLMHTVVRGFQGWKEFHPMDETWRPQTLLAPTATRNVPTWRSDANRDRLACSQGISQVLWVSTLRGSTWHWRG